MTKKETKEILNAHLEWIKTGGTEGKRADLSYADLSYANLSYADLSYAHLSTADLRYADLSYANLSYADLSYANLRSANLSYADLSSANLSSADLSSADLRDADLSYANLRDANLSSAKTTLSDLLLNNSAATLLSQNWGSLPDDLTLELMRHDAESCGAEAMTTWAGGGKCPFSNSVRDYQFTEKRELWKPGAPTLRSRALLDALWTAKGGAL